MKKTTTEYWCDKCGLKIENGQGFIIRGDVLCLSETGSRVWAAGKILAPGSVVEDAESHYHHECLLALLTGMGPGAVQDMDE